jgi:hypothetical protein
MALKKITYTDESRGVWSCPDCGWESEIVDFRRNPTAPHHYCPNQERRGPAFDSDDITIDPEES